MTQRWSHFGCPARVRTWTSPPVRASVLPLDHSASLGDRKGPLPLNAGRPSFMVFAISIAKDLSSRISLVNTPLANISLAVIALGMARVPITVMGYRCERCGHEWIPRGPAEEEPRVCPKCRSPWWNKPRKSMMTYDDFRSKVAAILRNAGGPLTWTEIRTSAGLPQLFPNNQWVHRLEKDSGLTRRRDSNGVVHWQLSGSVDQKGNEPTTKVADTPRARARRGKGAVE